MIRFDDMEKSGEAYEKVVAFSSLEELKKEQESQSRYSGHHSNCVSLSNSCQKPYFINQLYLVF